MPQDTVLTNVATIEESVWERIVALARSAEDISALLEQKDELIGLADRADELLSRAETAAEQAEQAAEQAQESASDIKITDTALRFANSITQAQLRAHDDEITTIKEQLDAMI